MKGVSLIATTLLSWLRLLALDGDLAKAEPKTLRPGPARRREADPRRPPPAAENPGALALGKGHSHRLGPDYRPATRTLTSEKPPLRYRREQPGGLWNPRPPARRPGRRHTPIVKSRTVQQFSRGPGPALRPHESSGLARALRDLGWSAPKLRPTASFSSWRASGPAGAPDVSGATRLVGSFPTARGW